MAKTIEDTLFYYKGEKRNPYKATDVEYLFWELEYSFIHNVKDTCLEMEYLHNFVMDFPDFLDDISKEVITVVKGFLYDQYCHVGGSKEGFKKWFTEYVYSAKKEGK